MPATRLELVGEHLDAAGQTHSLGHAVVGRIRHQHPVTVVDVAQEDVQHRLADAGGDDDLPVRVVPDADVGLIALADRLSQLGQAVKRKVAVEAVYADGVPRCFYRVCGRGQIRIGIFETETSG